jgi:hypothetical protein
MGLNKVMEFLAVLEDMAGKSNVLLNSTMARRLFTLFHEPDEGRASSPSQPHKPTAAAGSSSGGKRQPRPGFVHKADYQLKWLQLNPDDYPIVGKANFKSGKKIGQSYNWHEVPLSDLEQDSGPDEDSGELE